MEDRQLMESHGWRIRHSRDVAGTPEMYQAYIQGSRGEFSCAKATCMKFQNAWISDRTLCYLASGKPVVVQDTGPSAYLPSGEGLFRFSTLGGAVEALASINAEYERHCRAAREIAEAYFDAGQVVERLLNCALK
jgi:glycosyltransferase involved in cell wall biosynthesis